MFRRRIPILAKGSLTAGRAENSLKARRSAPEASLTVRHARGVSSAAREASFAISWITHRR